MTRYRDMLQGGAEHARALEEIALSEVGINAYIAKLNIVSDKVIHLC